MARKRKAGDSPERKSLLAGMGGAGSRTPKYDPLHFLPSFSKGRQPPAARPRQVQGPRAPRSTGGGCCGGCALAALALVGTFAALLVAVVVAS